MAEHALLSASSAERWLNCTPSARITEYMLETTSEYAAEGRLAHALGELELSYQLKEITKRTYDRRLKDIRKHELYSEEMPDYIEIYTNYVFEKLAEAQSHTPDALQPVGTGWVRYRRLYHHSRRPDGSYRSQVWQRC
jgi:hypothetical protein